jgi:uncharacterized repeat protein (TIGR03803 family)
LLYSFCAQAKCSDGAYSYAGLLADAAGNLYGTTAQGGGGARGNGVVFKLAPDGTLSVLHAFSGKMDGRQPQANLIVDSAGNLTGTTAFGGTRDAGTVFRITPGGKETVLYAFQAGSDGAGPYGPLVADAAGNLYGTTYYGGDPACSSGCGTVFKIAADGTETVLHAFTGGHGGEGSSAGLVLLNGYLYGTTQFGGIHGCANGCGTVFRLKE